MTKARSSTLGATVSDKSRAMDTLVGKALKRAAQNACEMAQVSSHVAFEKRVVYESDGLSLCNSLETQRLGIAALKHQRKGTASVNATQPEAIDQAVDSAVAIAEHSLADEFHTFADAKQAPPAETLGFLYDEELAELEVDQLIEYVEMLRAELQRDPRVSIDRLEVGLSVTRQAITNSRNVFQEERQAMLTWAALVAARDGDEVTQMDYEGGFSWSPAVVPERIAATGRKLRQSVLGRLRPGRAQSYTGPVLLSPRAVHALLLSPSLAQMSGRSVMDKISRWADAVGDRVAAELLTVTDEPRGDSLSGVTAYDGDGVPTRRNTLIDSGVLKLHVLDCYTAHRLGGELQGLAGGPFALTVRHGDTPLADLRRARAGLLAVDRFSGNTDPLSGTFSGVAKGSRLWNAGEDGGPVVETMISGDIFAALNSIVGVSQEVENVGGGFLAPWMLVDGVSVSAG